MHWAPAWHGSLHHCDLAKGVTGNDTNCYQDCLCPVLEPASLSSSLCTFVQSYVELVELAHWTGSVFDSLDE
jgi:hypothetical protein